MIKMNQNHRTSTNFILTVVFITTVLCTGGMLTVSASDKFVNISINELPSHSENRLGDAYNVINVISYIVTYNNNVLTRGHYSVIESDFLQSMDERCMWGARMLVHNIEDITNIDVYIWTTTRWLGNRTWTQTFGEWCGIAEPRKIQTEDHQHVVMLTKSSLIHNHDYDLTIIHEITPYKDHKGPSDTTFAVNGYLTTVPGGLRLKSDRISSIHGVF